MSWLRDFVDFVQNRPDVWVAAVGLAVIGQLRYFLKW